MEEKPKSILLDNRHDRLLDILKALRGRPWNKRKIVMDLIEKEAEKSGYDVKNGKIIARIGGVVMVEENNHD